MHWTTQFYILLDSKKISRYLFPPQIHFIEHNRFSFDEA